MRNLVFVGIVLSGAALGLGYLRHLTRLDPFARFSERQLGDVAIRLQDVDVRHYKGDKLMSRAQVASLEVHRDKRTFDLSNVVNGVYYSDEGKIDFTADTARWDGTRLQLEVLSGANLKHTDFDLEVPEFTIDQKESTVKVPGEIKGRLMAGRISAKNFLYHLKDGSYRVGPAMWVGTPNLQDAPVQGKSKWTFSAEGGVRYKRDIEVWENAEATDGEVIVVGKKIERNAKTDVITATGEVLYYSPKSNLACDQVVVYRKEKRAVLTGNVRMLIKPKDSMERELTAEKGEIPPFRPDVPDSIAANAPPAEVQSEAEKKLEEEIRSGSTTRKYPTVVLGEKVEYWYAKGSRRAIVTGKPQAKQEIAANYWRQAWATTAIYDGEKETLRLNGTEGKQDVRMKTSIGDDIVATWFELSTKEGDDEYRSGKIGGTVMARDEDIPKDEKTEEPPKTEDPPKEEPSPSPPPRER